MCHFLPCSEGSIFLCVSTIKIIRALEFSHWSRFNNYPRACLLTIYANDSGFAEQNKLSDVMNEFICESCS